VEVLRRVAAAAASVADLHGDAAPLAAEGPATVLKMLDERRTNLTQQRTRTLNQLHALLRELLPSGTATDLTADRASTALARVRPASAVEQARKDLARELVPDIRRLDERSRRTGRACKRRAVRPFHRALRSPVRLCPCTVPKLNVRPVTCRFALDQATE
jgi:transposase